MRSCSETCWWVTDRSDLRRTVTAAMSVGPDVDMVEGNEGMEQPAVAAAAAGAQGSGGRRHSEMPATIAAHEADGSQSSQEPDVQRHRHEDDRYRHQHAREDFDDQHERSPSSYLDSKHSISYLRSICTTGDGFLRYYSRSS